MTASAADRGAQTASNGLPRHLAPLPVQTLAEAVPHLRRPFTPEAVRWKIQTNPKSDSGSALVVCFIDARLVTARLNLVCPGLWSVTTREAPFPNAVVACLTICGQSFENVGWFQQVEKIETSRDADRAEIAVKGCYSDALKRAAVLVGVGESLHAQSRHYIPAAQLKKSGNSWSLPDTTLSKLARGYRNWLESAANTFGEALDHGDVEGSQGDPEAGE